MGAALNQRWLDGNNVFRPREVIDPSRYEVAAVTQPEAKAFVRRHHYSGSFPADRFRYGLYERGAGLVGVAVFSVPANYAAFNCFAGFDAGRQKDDFADLGRFVLLDRVPGNGETWFLARCFRRLRQEGVAGVVSFSDPCRRTNRHGDVVFGGHIGTIYQAANAVYVGRGTARTLRLLPDGTVFSEKAMCKLRARAAGKPPARSRGWRYAVEALVGAGAEPPAAGEDLLAWLRRWRGEVTEPLRHAGNHKYAWVLNEKVKVAGGVRRVVLPPGLPYPKRADDAR